MGRGSLLEKRVEMDRSSLLEVGARSSAERIS